MADPAAVEHGGKLLGIGTEALEITMFKPDDGAAILRSREGDFEIGHKIRVKSEFRIHLPMEQKFCTWFPRSDCAPADFFAIGINLIPLAAFVRFHHHVTVGGLAHGSAHAPPLAHMLGE